MIATSRHSRLSDWVMNRDIYSVLLFFFFLPSSFVVFSHAFSWSRTIFVTSRIMSMIKSSFVSIISERMKLYVRFSFCSCCISTISKSYRGEWCRIRTRSVSRLRCFFYWKLSFLRYIKVSKPLLCRNLYNSIFLESVSSSRGNWFLLKINYSRVDWEIILILISYKNRLRQCLFRSKNYTMTNTWNTLKEIIEREAVELFYSLNRKKSQKLRVSKITSLFIDKFLMWKSNLTWLYWETTKEMLNHCFHFTIYSTRYLVKLREIHQK